MQETQSDQMSVQMHQRAWVEGTSPDSRWLAASEHEYILFGMDWVALVGGAPSRLAKKHIRLYRACMHTPYNGQSTVVGLATEAGPVSSEAVAYSAAALFADAFRLETAACLIILSDGQCWMVAAHQGRVLVQTDRWFKDIDQARQTIDGIEQRFPHLRVFTHHLGEQDAMPQWALRPVSVAARLIRAQRFTGRTTQLIICLTLVSILLIYIWIMHDQHKPSAQDGELNTQSDLLQQWHDAIVSRQVHGEQEIFNLVTAWDQVPVFPGGWRLERIECQPEISRWHCTAAFHRSHVLASAESLIHSLPTGWRPEFIPLDQASVSFSSESIPQRLEASRQTSSVGWISHLQKIRVAFEHIQVGPPVSILNQYDLTAVPGEMTTAKAMALSWKKRSIHIRGPLRSIALLKGWDMPGWWRQVTLELRDSDHAAPGQSRFMLTLNGEMYERQN